MQKMLQIIALLVVLNVLVCAAEAQTNSPEIKIGVIVPLSGDMALHGTEIERAMNLAKKSLENTHYRYRLLFEDNKLQSADSVTAAKRLVDIEHVDAIVTLWPPAAEAVLPITERQHILHYTIAWDPGLAKKHSLLLSHQAMVDDIAVQTVALLKKNDISKVAFLHMEETGFNLGASFIREVAAKQGVSLVADEAFSPDERDATSLIARVQRKQPDGYLVWGVLPSLDIVVRRIRAAQPDAFITGYFDYAKDLSQIEGSPYISEVYASPGFVDAYRTAYRTTPQSKGANAYDIFNLLVWAYESSPDKKLSAAELKRKLITTRDYAGAVGTFSIDADGNSRYTPVWRKIEGGKSKLLN